MTGTVYSPEAHRVLRHWIWCRLFPRGLIIGRELWCPRCGRCISNTEYVRHGVAQEVPRG